MFMAAFAGVTLAPPLALVMQLFVPSSIWSAALLEETAKAIVIFGVFRVFRFEIDGSVDALIYSLLVAMGFGFTENTFYFAAHATVPLDDLAIVSPLVQRFSAMTGHLAFTGMTGVGLALWLDGGPRLRIPMGFAGAVVLHYWWDAVTESGPLMFWIRSVPLCLVLLFAFVRFRRHEALVIHEYSAYCSTIQCYVEGEQEEFTDATRRFEIIAELITAPWNSENRARYRHFCAVSQLAFLRRNISRGAVRSGPWAELREQQLIRQIRETDKRLRRDGSVPGSTSSA